jgi:phospholipase A-2-activating protein
MGEQLDMS